MRKKGDFIWEKTERRIVKGLVAYFSIDSPSALYAAAYYNHMAIAELLIKAGADVNKRNSKG